METCSYKTVLKVLNAMTEDDPDPNVQKTREGGGWSWSGGYQGLTLMDGGIAFANQEATAGSSYQEYSITNATAELKTFVYECCPNEPWPVVSYRISLGRASAYYT